MSITDFLLARIAEDEAVANNARGLLGIENPWWTWGNLKSRFNGLSRADTMHIAQHSPARVLAECAAKRAIVELHQPYEIAQRMTYGDIHPCMTCGSVDDSPEPFPCPTIRTLAAVYAEHPAYLDEWRVGA